MAKNYQGRSPDAAPGPAPRLPSSKIIAEGVAKDQAITKARNKPHYDRTEKEHKLLRAENSRKSFMHD